VAGWYHLGGDEIIFSYGKTASTFLHNINKKGKHLKRFPGLSEEFGLFDFDQVSKQLVVKEKILPYIVVRHPLERFISGMHMILNGPLYISLWGPEKPRNKERNKEYWLDLLNAFNQMHIPDDTEWYRMTSEFISKSGENDIFKLLCIQPGEQYHIGNYMIKTEQLKMEMCIIDLGSLNFFLQQRNIDFEDIDTHSHSAYSDKHDYEHFKEIFSLCDAIEKINNYLEPEIKIYNKLINFELPNVIKVYMDNKEITCPT